MKIHNTYNSQSGFNRVTLITFLFVAIVIISSLLYFFVLRLADGDYQTPATQVKSLKDSSNALTAELAIIQDPANITSSAVTKVQNAVNTYQKSISILEKNAVISRDSVIKSTYDQVKSSLEKYGQSASSLAKSLKLYVAALDSCAQFTESISKKDLSLENSLLKNCLSALNEGQSSSYQAFDDQYFDEYISVTSTYVEAIVSGANATDKTTFNTAQASINQAYGTISKLGKKKIDYSLSLPSDALNKLSTALDSQKKALIR
jgi:hypothetical protein